ncbi:MAG TPA: disulfide bond formation protein DsbA [Gammaproteobacteria bacterium]|nr:disulfide bond formation protein DsbA [Gammaproteobacteria bacterium]
MRKLIVLLALLTLLPMTAWSEFEEGVNYTRYPRAFPVATGDKIEVREIFWYGCPHCYNIEPEMQRWEKNSMPDNAELIRMPGIFRESWVPYARAFYAFQAMGILDKMHDALLIEIHQKKNRITTREQIADLVEAKGFDRKAFLSAYNSFSVDSQSRQAAIMTKRYGITGVPAIIVDGRFVTGAGQAGGQKQLFELINHLVGLATEEREKVAEK